MKVSQIKSGNHIIMSIWQVFSFWKDLAAILIDSLAITETAKTETLWHKYTKQINGTCIVTIFYTATFLLPTCFFKTVTAEAVARRHSLKKVFLKISQELCEFSILFQNSKQNTCARLSFLIKLQALGVFEFILLRIFPAFFCIRTEYGEIGSTSRTRKKKRERNSGNS